MLLTQAIDCLCVVTARFDEESGEFAVVVSGHAPYTDGKNCSGELQTKDIPENFRTEIKSAITKMLEAMHGPLTVKVYDAIAVSRDAARRQGEPV